MKLVGRLFSSATGFLVAVTASGLATPPPVPPVGAGTYDQYSWAVVQQGTWKVAISDHDHGKSTGYTGDPDASASLTFTGTRIRWLARTSPSSGMADVLIDGTRVDTVDLYSPATRYRQVVFERSDLSEGTHTIRIVRTGDKNVRARSANIVLDAFVVPETEAPGVPTGVSLETDRAGVRVRWDAPPAEDVEGYRVYRRHTSLDDWSLISGKDPIQDQELTDVALDAGSPYRYSVRSVDDVGNESELSAVALGVGPSFHPATDYRYENCPAATDAVSNSMELEEALAQAGPGDVLRLEDGRYAPFDVRNVAGAHGDPVWICGGPGAVVDRADPRVATGVYVDRSEHVVIAGLTVQRSRKGVVVDRSDNVVVADLNVSDVGEEGIHLRLSTSHSWVVGNTVERTGLVNPGFGEGIYIGSSTTNWCDLNDCRADEANFNVVVGNTLSGITAEGIEAKEGTWGGTIAGNTIYGADMVPESGGFVQIKGNDWLIMDNYGTQAPRDGMRIIRTNDDLGLDNMFVNNHMTLRDGGFGIYADYLEDETVVACNNSVMGADRGLSNVECQP